MYSVCPGLFSFACGIETSIEYQSLKFCCHDNFNNYSACPFLASKCLSAFPVMCHLCLHSFLFTFQVFVLFAMCVVGGLHGDCVNASLTTSASGFEDSIAIFAKSDFRASEKSY